ncbi:Pentatricopeptide repeat-containing protein [Heracleum sosnowskyi]|uniref:Pentatricopeptide repeat-containing protein n=1 Tax=Heracleum sosnowskyi TaxID=360622 RepID=A0AAD8MHR2_9APIA|nr:Pentatricopeptide repeat-containing protein [Heracleum sosnowskyi]
MIPTIASTLKQKFKINPKPIFTKHFFSTNTNQYLISQLPFCKKASEITQIHGYMIKNGLDTVAFPVSKLLAASIIDTHYAISIFKFIQTPNVFMFNTMLRCYSVSDYPNEALVMFNYMRAVGVLLDEFSFVSVIKSCARLFEVRTGCVVHALAFKTGNVLHVCVRNTVLQLYCVCRKIEDACKVFEDGSVRRDLVSWNVMMGGYLYVCRGEVVLNLFKRMLLDGVRVEGSTMLSVLSGVSEVGGALEGECLHCYCVKCGFVMDANVVTALVGMYGKIGKMDSGRSAFDEVEVKDVVLWNCLMDVYAKNGMLEEALNLLRLMKNRGVRANSSTLAGLLSFCATSGALAVGKCIHEYVEQQQLVLDAVLGTALLDMYCKCGLLREAVDVFKKMVSKDVKCWTAMILGYGMHGEAKDAIMIFYQMAEEGFRHNEVTFLAVLSACSHGGLVAEGTGFFKIMIEDYGLKPKVEHYGCMIDLFGRAGLLEEAHNLIKSLPIKSDAAAWRALLAACRVYGNVDLGKSVKKALEDNYGEHPADSIILSSTYAVAGSRPCLQTTQVIGRKIEDNYEYGSRGVKEAGCSAIELGNNDD